MVRTSKLTMSRSSITGYKKALDPFALLTSKTPSSFIYFLMCPKIFTFASLFRPTSAAKKMQSYCPNLSLTSMMSCVTNFILFSSAASEATIFRATSFAFSSLSKLSKCVDSMC
ncbi:hypothetical protein V8G54_026244 [Vigna mungo]|uniref:Uncharacterized protein n=1 Tax=Vigna mungo TaxID=3915 RepID=A0AAQ3N081_VIGMU